MSDTYNKLINNDLYSDKIKSLSKYNYWALGIHSVITILQIGLAYGKIANWKYRVDTDESKTFIQAIVDTINLKYRTALSEKIINFEIIGDKINVKITNTSNQNVSDNNLKNSAGNEYSITSDKKELLTIFKSKFYFDYDKCRLTNTNTSTNIPMTISREFFNFLSTTKRITCVPLAASVIAFSLICAIAHGLVLYSGKNFNGKANYYQMILVNKINYFRWFEYTISSAIMVVNIAALARISNVYQLANIAILTGITNLFGLWMEQTDVNSPRAIPGSRIIAFVAGFITFFPPWIIIINKFVKDGRYFVNEVKPFIEASGNKLPSALDDYETYVKIAAYGLFGIYLLFPLNMFLQYWIYPKYFEKKAYYYGEIGYIFLSMISKVFLSLTIFIGALQPTDGGQPVNCGN